MFMFHSVGTEEESSLKGGGFKTVKRERKGKDGVFAIEFSALETSRGKAASKGNFLEERAKSQTGAEEGGGGSARATVKYGFRPLQRKETIKQPKKESRGFL